jgi:anthranilate synthase/aminodeoxychorismate synthase-like glutamine amidotransferase
MLLVIDNYDSFTYNLVQLLGALGAAPVVVRNDERPIEELVSMSPSRVVVSPGPCTPAEAGTSVAAFREFGGRGIPMLGVCLGHQSLGEAFGGRTVRAKRTVHGKVGPIRHDGDVLFDGIPSPFLVARYHSLVTDERALPEELEAIAWSSDPADEAEIQAVRHRSSSSTLNRCSASTASASWRTSWPGPPESASSAGSQLTPPRVLR